MKVALSCIAVALTVCACGDGTKRVTSGLPGDAEFIAALSFRDSSFEGSKAEAARWFQKAADKGHARAQFNLALCYMKGDGVERSVTNAAAWFLKAAEQGVAVAQQNVGNCYDGGVGVEESAVKAAKWYRRAAMQGEAGAQCRLGFYCSVGKGVPKDNVEAYKWFNLAAAKGEKNADKSRDILESSMTADQVAEARRQSSLFVATPEK